MDGGRFGGRAAGERRAVGLLEIVGAQQQERVGVVGRDEAAAEDARDARKHARKPPPFSKSQAGGARAPTASQPPTASHATTTSHDAPPALSTPALGGVKANEALAASQSMPVLGSPAECFRIVTGAEPGGDGGDGEAGAGGGGGARAFFSFDRLLLGCGLGLGDGDGGGGGGMCSTSDAVADDDVIQLVSADEP